MKLWQITSTPSSDDAEIVTRGVFDYGRGLASGGGAQSLACFVREGDSVIGGGIGRTEYNRLFVSSLWVSERYRGQGIGSEILLRMEREASDRGCRDALIETLIDANLVLYGRLGYKSVATITNYVGPFTRHIMVKDLSSNRGENV